MKSQPYSRSRSAVVSSSTPSATTCKPRLWPRSMVERTIAAPSRFVVMSCTNDLSILISRTGRRLRYVSDEYPVPKSSTAICTPVACSRSNVSSASVAMMVRSVISRLSFSGGTCQVRSSSATASGSSASSRLRADRLTETPMSMPAFDQAWTWPRASLSTQAVNGLIRAVRSAGGVAWLGGAGEGCDHRLEELFRDHDGGRPIGRAQGDHRKLGAAVSGDRVGLAKHASHPLSDLLQHPIAGLVAEAVVDAFETVKVEEKHSDGFQLPLTRPDRLFEPLPQECPIGHPGQRIVERPVLQRLGLGLAVGDVPQAADDQPRWTEPAETELQGERRVVLP